jgi:hypothetical protein
VLLLWLSFLSRGFVLDDPGCCDTSSPRRVSYINSFGAHPRFVPKRPHGSKKKPNPGTSKEANASTEVQPSTNNALVTTNGNNNNDEDNGENVSVDDLAKGEFEVDLTTRKRAKGPSQRYQLLLQPVLMQQQLVLLASGAQREGFWYRVEPPPGTKTRE